jgi:hypothetical protein
LGLARKAFCIAQISFSCNHFLGWGDHHSRKTLRQKFPNVSQLIIAPDGEAKLISNEIDPAALTAYYDHIEAAERDLPPIKERLDALTDAMADGWCPSRVLENELEHLDQVLSAYHFNKYRDDVMSLLGQGEADLLIWRLLTEEQRDARRAQREAEEAERERKRVEREAACARKAAIYESAKRTGIPLSPAMEEALAWIA